MQNQSVALSIYLEVVSPKENTSFLGNYNLVEVLNWQLVANCIGFTAVVEHYNQTLLLTFEQFETNFSEKHFVSWK